MRLRVERSEISRAASDEIHQHLLRLRRLQHQLEERLESFLASVE